MPALVDELALVEDDDAVGLQHGGEQLAITSEVRPHQALQRHLHQPLVLGVERAGGLVEEQERRVAQDRARDRDPLPLAAGQAQLPRRGRSRTLGAAGR